MNLKDRIKQAEGFSKFPYTDSVGKLTIGYGRNLDDIGVSEAEAEFLLDNDLSIAKIELLSRFPWVESLSEARQSVLIEMSFNLGITRFSKFVGMLEAIQTGDWQTAADEMMDSKWAEQVGLRAQRLARIMRTDLESDVPPFQQA